VDAAQQHTGEESGLTEYLKSVAATENKPSIGGKAFYRTHHGGKTGNGSYTKIITVGKATGEDHTVVGGKVSLLVPDIFDFLPEDIEQHMVEVHLAPGAGEDDHPKSHHQ
jgi:hypothetical protein